MLFAVSSYKTKNTLYVLKLAWLLIATCSKPNQSGNVRISVLTHRKWMQKYAADFINRFLRKCLFVVYDRPYGSSDTSLFVITHIYVSTLHSCQMFCIHVLFLFLCYFILFIWLLFYQMNCLRTNSHLQTLLGQENYTRHGYINIL